jgi:TonB family protein
MRYFCALMAKIIFYSCALACIIISTYSKAQVPDTSGGKKLYAYQVQDAQFKGNINNYISKNMKYPVAARLQNIEGRVKVKFRVNKEGIVDSAYIVEPVHPLLDSEAIRLVMAMPRWTPGKFWYSDNKKFAKVPCYFELPLKFTLEKEGDRSRHR